MEAEQPGDEPKDDLVAHGQSVGELAGALALEMGWGLTRCERIVEAAAAHDEGKAMIPAGLIDKPSALSAGEFAEVTQHALLGACSLEPFLSIEQVGWVLHHHERWDGLGYPDGLSGEDIPEGARIIAVANSSWCSPSESITTVHHAMAMIGTREIRVITPLSPL